jgi:hypothetical protein
MDLVEYGAGGRRGLFIIAKRRDDKGWKAFSCELCGTLVHFHLFFGEGCRAWPYRKPPRALPSLGGSMSRIVGGKLYAKVLVGSGLLSAYTSTLKGNFGHSVANGLKDGCQGHV